MKWWEELGPILIVVYGVIAMAGAIVGIATTVIVYVTAAALVGVLMAWAEYRARG